MRQSQSDFHPRVQMALLNTTIAEQGTTLPNEVLGASTGRPNQTFSTTQSPVLAGQRLEVAEPIWPPKEEERRIRDDEGDDAIRRLVIGDREQIWVRWHEVPNFNGSGPRDRHYMLNRQTGEVRFGDALNGLIPPALAGNIRMASYRTGGGISGNKPVFAIKQLKTAVPYVSKVVNWLPADGGGDAETKAALLDRGPRMLRHGNRAVALEDFEDLAMLASEEVARAKCIPLYDLETDLDARFRKPGTVSVIIVPRSADPMPKPGTQLLASARNFLLAAAQATVNVVMVGPEYVAVDVDTEIVVDDPDIATTVELGVTLAIVGFLHPVTGNSDGLGWDFGRMPQKSELYKVIGDVDGVSHARNLQLSLRPFREGAEKTSRSLACCGKLNIFTTLRG
jgi:predicted phage baseplate assembly protein